MNMIEEYPIEDAHLTVSVQRVTGYGESTGESRILDKHLNCLKHAQIGEEIGVRFSDNMLINGIVYDKLWTSFESMAGSKRAQTWLTIFVSEP